ncbi:arylsulfatase A-like enzyme [Flavobacteriaceae bacterium MAR_2010_72]|nr:arylsulfatase A-like enzyme [Flavobacteriaceae bacterium MAR_2010_72]
MIYFNSNIKLFLSAIIVMLLVACKNKPKDLEVEEKQPNIVFILADDLGYGDVEHFNKDSKIPTPNLNQMANEGVSFTNAHSPAAVCTPTRYSFLTGLYPWRGKKKRGVSWIWDKPTIKKDQFTIGQMLQEQGYHTACVGKWHLGWNWPTTDGLPATVANEGKNVDYSKAITGGPTERGFNYYFGDDTPGFPPHTFIENNRTVQNPDTWYEVYPFVAGASTKDWRYEDLLSKTTAKAENYIVERSKEDQPFFLFYSMTAPHTPIAPHEDFQGKTNAGIYGDFVYEVDYSVGRILKTLDSLGLAENTLVIFTSDNGSTTQDGTGYHGEIGSMMRNYSHDGSGGLRGHKADIYEGGHRVPFIAKWKGKIKPNNTSTAILQHTDMMHTFAALTNHNLKDNTGEDSFNVLPNLLDGNKNSSREALVTQSSKGVIAIQKENWKLIMSSGSGGHWTKPIGEYPKLVDNTWENVQLYNLENDLKETNNIASQHPEKINELALQLGQYIVDGRSRKGDTTKENIELWEQVKWVEHLSLTIPKI